ESLAERAGGRFEYRKKALIGMTLVDGAELAQRVQLLLGRVTRFSQHCIEHGYGMAFGENEPVAIRPRGIRGIVPHDATEVQRRQNLDRGKRSAGMARLGRSDHFDNV